MSFNSKNCKFVYGAVDGTPSTEITGVITGTFNSGEVVTIDSTTITDGTATLASGHQETMDGSITVAFDYGAASHLAITTAHLAGTEVSIGYKEYDDSGPPGNLLKFSYGNALWITAPVPIAVNGLLQATFTFKGTGALTISSS